MSLLLLLPGFSKSPSTLCYSCKHPCFPCSTAPLPQGLSWTEQRGSPQPLLPILLPSALLLLAQGESSSVGSAPPQTKPQVEAGIERTRTLGDTGLHPTDTPACTQQTTFPACSGEGPPVETKTIARNVGTSWTHGGLRAVRRDSGHWSKESWEPQIREAVLCW